MNSDNIIPTETTNKPIENNQKKSINENEELIRTASSYNIRVKEHSSINWPSFTSSLCEFVSNMTCISDKYPALTLLINDLIRMKLTSSSKMIGWRFDTIKKFSLLLDKDLSDKQSDQLLEITLMSDFIVDEIDDTIFESP